MLAESPLSRRAARSSRRWSEEEEELGIVKKMKEDEEGQRSCCARSLDDDAHYLFLFSRCDFSLSGKRLLSILQALTSDTVSRRRTRPREGKSALRTRNKGARSTTTTRPDLSATASLSRSLSSIEERERGLLPFPRPPVPLAPPLRPLSLRPIPIDP